MMKQDANKNEMSNLIVERGIVAFIKINHRIFFWCTYFQLFSKRYIACSTLLALVLKISKKASKYRKEKVSIHVTPYI